MAAAETARLIASLELQDKNFTRGIKQVERGIGRVDKKLGAFSGAVNRNVGRAVDNVTARLLEVPGAVISAAVEQESAITGIAKTIEGDITGITDELKKLSTETGSTFTELAGIAELGGAMGIAKDDVAAFTEQVAILGATTNVSVEDAASSLGQLKTVLGFTGDEFDNFAATLVDLGNKGNSTEAQILEITKRTGAAAKTIGIATDKTLAWASAAANLGLSEEIAGTALSKLFVGTQKIIARGGEDLADIGKVAGMTGKQFKKAFDKDASGALFTFIEGLKGLSKEQRVLAIEDLFGRGDAMTKTLLGLAEALDDPTSGLTASLENANTAWIEGTAAQEEADKRFKTSEFLFKRLGNSVNLVAATIGTELLPVLNDLATEGLEFLNKPATQKGIKDFAKGLGAGIRGLAGIVTSINWSAVAGFLSTAAGFAGQLVTWFTKMPDWAQAFLIGGFVATKLPVIGDIVTSALKGALGITAGVVHLKAASVVGGGVPAGGAAGAAGGTAGKIMSAVRILGAVTIAGASIALLAQTFQDFATGVGESQTDLLEKVNKTSTQGFKETIANLQSTNTAIKNMNPLENVLAGIFGGSEITKNFELGADRIVGQLKAGALDRDEIVTALNTLTEVRETSPEAELPKTDAAIAALTAAIRQMPRGDPKQPLPVPKGPTTVTIKPGDAMFALFARQQASTKASIDNAKSIASRENSATREKVNQVAVKAQATANAVKNAQSIASRENSAQQAEIARAKQAAATAGRVTSAAARAAGTTTAGAMSAAASRIVGAVSALDLSVNVTTVNRTSTVNNRYGPSGGSSTTQRAGGNTG